MYPTLASVPAADDSDDLKIYEFDREASMDWALIVNCSLTAPGGRFHVGEEVLAA